MSVTIRVDDEVYAELLKLKRELEEMSQGTVSMSFAVAVAIERGQQEDDPKTED